MFFYKLTQNACAQKMNSNISLESHCLINVESVHISHPFFFQALPLFSPNCINYNIERQRTNENHNDLFHLPASQSRIICSQFNTTLLCGEVLGILRNT